MARDPEKQSDQEALIDVRDLVKTFKTGLFMRKTVEAVRGVSFKAVRREIVGFLGPNGSGKTTTIKILLGLIRATRGEAFMFGQPVPSTVARKRIGFLPENPYVYPYLTPREFVEMSGNLSGMGGQKLRKRTEEVLEMTGVLYAADRQVRRLSKGMLQRAALGAALVADPELLILDEPMSGLDPVGRKEVREIILAEREKGKTIFFSTHILNDVETFADRVIILRKGKVAVEGAILDLLKSEEILTDVILAKPTKAFVQQLEDDDYEVQRRAHVAVVCVTGHSAIHEVLTKALDANVQVLEVAPHRETLEDLFMRRAL